MTAAIHHRNDKWSADIRIVWTPVTAVDGVWVLVFYNQAAIKIPYNTASKTI